MPFEKQYDLLFQQVLKPALETAGMHVLRADSVLDQHSVMRDVIEGIAMASLVVADISQVNANVYYELGLAHALLKPTVLLTQDIAKVPFDLKGYRVLAYSTLFHEVEQLSEKLAEIAREHLAGRVRFGSPVTDYLDPEQLTALRPTPTSVSPATGTIDPSEIQEDTGFIDWMADLHEADQRLGELLTEVAAATELVGEQMAKKTAEIEPLIEASQISPADARVWAHDAATDLLSYAEALGKIVPDFVIESDRFVDAGVSLAEWFREPVPDRSDGRREFRSSVQTLFDTLLEGRIGLVGYRDVIVGLRGVTSELNRASSRVSRHLDEMFESINKIVAFCERSIAIVPSTDGAVDQ